MFDEEKKSSQPKPDKEKAEQSIHTMPMEYYMGEKTVEASRDATKQKSVAPTSAPQSIAKSAPPQTAQPAKKKSSAGKIVIVIFLLALLIGSGYLLYQTYLAPTEQQVQFAEEPEESATVALPDEEQIIDEAPAMKEEPEEVVEQMPKEFDPADLNRFSLTILSSIDTDKDGLTDFEESLLGTDIARVDTDNDSYRDSLELSNLYSPIDFAPTRLSETQLVKEFENEIYNYKFLYPSEWLTEALDQENPIELMITSAAAEFINVIMDKKMPAEDIVDWYIRQAPQIQKNQVRKYKTYNGLTAIESPDGFTAYISKDNDVYIIHYNIGLKEEANFPNLFKLVVNSFEFVGEESEETDMSADENLNKEDDSQSVEETENMDTLMPEETDTTSTPPNMGEEDDTLLPAEETVPLGIIE